LLELLDGVEAFSLALDVFLLVLIIVGLHAHLQFLDELLLGVFVDDGTGVTAAL